MRLDKLLIKEANSKIKKSKLSVEANIESDINPKLTKLKFFDNPIYH